MERALTRECGPQELWRHRVLDLYLKLMCVEPWEVVALDAVGMMLHHDADRTEPRLLEKDAGRQLLTLLAEASRHTCNHMLEPFLKVSVFRTATASLTGAHTPIQARLTG
jgi:hypothetical protein